MGCIALNVSLDDASLADGERAGEGGLLAEGSDIDGLGVLECAELEGLDAFDGTDVGMVDFGNGYAGGGMFGGSIRLEIDGDSLARLALLGGDVCNVLDGD